MFIVHLWRIVILYSTYTILNQTLYPYLLWDSELELIPSSCWRKLSLNSNITFTVYIKHNIVPSDLDNSIWIYIWGSTMPVRSKFSWIQLSIFANSSPSNKCACQTLIKLQYQNLSNFLHIAVTSGLVLVLPTCYT